MSDSCERVVLLLVLMELDLRESARESIETSISLMVGRVLIFFAFFAGEERLSSEMLESWPCLAALAKTVFLRLVAGLEVLVELPLEDMFCTCRLLPVFLGFFGSKYRGFTLLNFDLRLFKGSVFDTFEPISSDWDRL